jgi:hypothetical protein
MAKKKKEEEVAAPKFPENTIVYELSLCDMYQWQYNGTWFKVQPSYEQQFIEFMKPLGKPFVKFDGYC